jgi:predicted thioesterase
MTNELNIAVTMATLESRNHIVGDIERGAKIYNGAGVEFDQDGPNSYRAAVPHKGNDRKSVFVTFSKDGRDLDDFYCDCTASRNPGVLCRHVVALVLAIQGGVIPSNLTLGKTATVSAVVTKNNTAKAAGSGNLEVFATPMMIALMERAACECLADCLEPGQTSVGTGINILHTAASPVGMEITATAVIEYVFGSRIEFKIAAGDGAGEIGNGKHTRVIVDAKRFVDKSQNRQKCKSVHSPFTLKFSPFE